MRSTSEGCTYLEFNMRFLRTVRLKTEKSLGIIKIGNNKTTAIFEKEFSGIKDTQFVL